jgi:hypothetical protein
MSGTSPLAAILGFTLLTACVPPALPRDADGGTGYLITADRILRSGATDAWEALVRTSAPVNLTETPNGEPRGMSKRGRSTILLSATPLLVVDDILMSDFHYLRRIPAETVAWIRILNGADGTSRYGTGAGNGVVVVKTRPR